MLHWLSTWFVLLGYNVVGYLAIWRSMWTRGGHFGNHTIKDNLEIAAKQIAGAATTHEAYANTSVTRPHCAQGMRRRGGKATFRRRAMNPSKQLRVGIRRLSTLIPVCIVPATEQATLALWLRYA